MMTNFGKISCTARYLPEKVVTNDDLAKILATSDEWIRSRTGIEKRHVVTDENTSDMCIKVAQQLIRKSGINAEQLDFILVATMSPDYTTPSVACQVQGVIGAKQAIAFDISAACSGFVYGLSVAEKFIRTGSQYGLVIGGETFSKLLDWQDRSTAVLFGDGAAGILVEAQDTPSILREKLAADGIRNQSLTAGFQANKSPFFDEKSESSYYLKMIGRDIFDFALRDVVSNIQEVVGEEKESIDYFLLHQANERIIEKISKKLKVPREKFLTNMSNYGNTSAASIPILLDEAVENGKIQLGSNQKIVFTGYGGGLTWGSMLLTL
ncbi:3-oxoacyl-[acyl-carrier-protein] synthase III [Enterococcus phoeniculicola ATCC BAA-412]|jgi:3-oxoacyl-[acyl-carrier-protein] synthase-3|uniref:Beta-ketoacyl-[acyl-carrier-protein] synthase III n=2 Tax=Enterococcus phoeniculicola TaxID=154621 RepID=R3U2H4_9ENTE|nr:3-oxoacyl-[acyl-carrier-protein] synthase III [Enterococcus phoeniculicola ATCC BAA-412]EOT72868.1 3-oxoacyl-ACP synthase [Enterococcus phoeniculicola ATCC BAA-412]